LVSIKLHNIFSWWEANDTTGKWSFAFEHSGSTRWTLKVNEGSKGLLIVENRRSWQQWHQHPELVKVTYEDWGTRGSYNRSKTSTESHWYHWSQEHTDLERTRSASVNHQNQRHEKLTSKLYKPISIERALRELLKGYEGKRPVDSHSQERD
jgi:hypothetical protein